MTTSYFNDFEPFVQPWLQAMHPGAVVDGRSITEVSPDDIRDYTRVCLFAGIGGWDYAFQLAGWPANRPVWSGSCPCQPFSTAGKRLGLADSRHLWPEMLRLIRECRPPTIFGEQVASKDGRLWLAGVRADLEALGYAVGAADLCAAGVGAPHIRQRLYWVAQSVDERTRGVHLRQGESRPAEADERGPTDRMADTESARSGAGLREGDPQFGRDGSGSSGGLGDPIDPRLERYARYVEDGGEPGRFPADAPGSAGPTGRFGHWDEFDLVDCLDGKTRRIEPGSFPLAHGVPARVGRLRAYGNTIVPQVAAEFVRAFLEAEDAD